MGESGRYDGNPSDEGDGGAVSDDEQVTSGVLPVYFTRFIGRQREIDALLQLITPSFAARQPGRDNPRLITLVGVGGAGKTRLAMEISRILSQANAGGDLPVPDCVQWADLAPVTDAGEVARTVASALDLRGAASLDPANAVINALRDKRALLVLDNCEEVAAACSELAGVLLPACPHLVIVATSRTVSNVAGEATFQVPPMSSEVPAPTPSAGHPVRSEATQLFYDRAGMVMPAYPILGGDEPMVEALCKRLDGLPLAIELAATWIRVLSARDLLAEIACSLNVLSSATPTLTGRHKSMRAVLDSSWRWLSDDDQQVLRGLGAFVGGFTREAAEAVTGATLASLASLAERSLINRLPDAGGGTRFGMHELVRQYALEMLERQEPVEVERVRQLHLDYFLTLVETAGAAWDGAGEVEWLKRLQREEANVNDALTWGLEHHESEQVLRMSAALFRVWIYTSPAGLHRNLLERVLTLPWDTASPVTMSARARTLNAAGYAALGVSDVQRGRRYFEEALVLYRELGDDGEYAFSLRGYSFALLAGGDPMSAQRYLRQSLTSCRAAGDAAGIAWSISDLGEATFAAGQLEEAENLLREGIEHFEQAGILFGAHSAQVTLGDIYLARGRWLDAIEAYGRGLGLQRQSNFTTRGADILGGLGEVSMALGRPDCAALLFGASQTWGQANGNQPPLDPSRDLQRSLDAARKQLGAEHWATNYTAGCRLTSEQAIAEAEKAGAELAALCKRPLPAGLTEREAEVVRLLAEGLSNADIAARLVVSTRTVHAHLRSVFDKLDVSTRTAAVHEASRFGLT